jgi:hypothetical protein
MKLFKCAQWEIARNFFSMSTYNKLKLLKEDNIVSCLPVVFTLSTVGDIADSSEVAGISEPRHITNDARKLA